MFAEKVLLGGNIGEAMKWVGFETVEAKDFFSWVHNRLVDLTGNLPSFTREYDGERKQYRLLISCDTQIQPVYFDDWLVIWDNSGGNMTVLPTERFEDEVTFLTNQGKPLEKSEPVNEASATPAKNGKTIGLYVKKPVQIQAIQMPDSKWWQSYRDHPEYTRDMSQLMNIASFVGDAIKDEIDDGLMISTLEGPLLARPSDWIIRGVNGEFYPCKPDIFEKTYDTVME